MGQVDRLQAGAVVQVDDLAVLGRAGVAGVVGDPVEQDRGRPRAQAGHHQFWQPEPGQADGVGERRVQAVTGDGLHQPAGGSDPGQHHLLQVVAGGPVGVFALPAHVGLLRREGGR